MRQYKNDLVLWLVLIAVTYSGYRFRIKPQVAKQATTLSALYHPDRLYIAVLLFTTHSSEPVGDHAH